MSHATAEYPYADAVKVREPVARPLDVVAVELLLSAAQAFLVGVLMYLAVGVWEDRGVGLGHVAILLALLGLAIGGSWIYWLFGGVGWPMAAANTPAAMFLGFTLVLSWFGEEFFHVPGVPLLIALGAAVYGVVGGVFLDSPRRWRWDQRQKLRPGTPVARVSPTTRALAAQLPRSLPTRSRPEVPTSELAARIEQSTPAGHEASDEVAIPYLDGGPPDGEATAEPAADASAPGPETDVASGSTAAPAAASPGRPDDDGAIELPTSIEPKAQRSPWAWAAPPEWNRDEDDEPPSRGSSKRP